MRRPLVGAALLLLAAILISYFAEADRPVVAPIRILLPTHVAFAPCDVTVRLRLHPVPSDRLVTIAAYDTRDDPPAKVRSSEWTIAGEDTPKLAVIPWRLDEGEYAIVATVGGVDHVRARATERFRVIGRE